MFLDYSANNYQKLIQEYFTDTPELVQQILKLAPTADEFSQLSTKKIKIIKITFNNKNFY